MARRELEDRNIRKLQRVGGGSYAVTIPIELIRDLKWREKQKVVVERVGDHLEIRDWKE